MTKVNFNNQDMTEVQTSPLIQEVSWKFSM